MIYLDTCALVKLVWDEESSAELVSWLNQRAGASYVSSALADLELRRTVWRVDPAAMPAADAVLAEVSMLPIEAEVIAAAGQLRHPYLRALDAIHLATAARVRALGDLRHFVTYDKRLRDSAAAAGLPVTAPGG